MSFLVSIVTLSLLGAIIRYAAHRKYDRDPRGPVLAVARARSMVLLVGMLAAMILLVLSVVLYLDLASFAGYRGSDWQINSGLPFLGYERSPVMDIVALALLMTYLPWFLLGALVMERRRGLGFPTIRDSIKLQRGKSVVVLADTHLGLRPNLPWQRKRGGPEWDPRALGGFFDWLGEWSDERRVKVWDEKRGGWDDQDLHPPAYVVLLGDVLEMWDATAESIQLALTTSFSKLNRLKARVWYYEVGGIFLSRASTLAYNTFQKALREILKDPDLPPEFTLEKRQEIRKLGSKFRSALLKDVRTRMRSRLSTSEV